MKKRFTLSLLLSLIWLCPAALQAQVVGDTFSEGGLDCKVTSAEAGSPAVEIAGGIADGTLAIPASIEHSGQTYAVASIADEAFKGSAISTLDLSVATNLQRIGASAFAECKQLETVFFPAAETSKLTEIGTQAFCHDFALKAMNLGDTRIEVLETLFTLEQSDEISIPGLKELKLPYTLKEIKSYALQCLDITEIRIPSTVTTIGDYVLQGCVYLKEFTWRGAQITSLPLHTFAYVGESLVKVTLLTMEPLQPDGLTDRHFYRIGTNPAPAEVILTPASIANLNAAGYTNENAIFSTLVAYDGDPSDPDEPITAIAAPTPTARATTDNARYTLQGQRVTTPQKGRLYIRNGQKFIYR